MKLSKLSLAALAACVVAAIALGQGTDTTAKGDYKITLVAPIEGASVAADQVRVVLTPSSLNMGDEKTQVDVFLDGHQKGVIKATETEFRVEGVKPGPHKLVLIARNPVTDKQFDRREISFTATGVGSTTTGASVTGGGESAMGAHVPPAVNSTERQHSYMATDSTQSSRSDLSASSSTTSASETRISENRVSENRSSYSSNPSSSGLSSENRVSSAPASTYTSPQPSQGVQMPQTASNDALLALAGAALLVTGALLRRSG